MTLSRCDIQAMVERAEQAALGPWTITKSEEVKDATGHLVQADGRRHSGNMEFICASREWVPALAAALLADRRAMEDLMAADSAGVTVEEANLTEEYIRATNAIRARLSGWRGEGWK